MSDVWMDHLTSMSTFGIVRSKPNVRPLDGSCLNSSQPPRSKRQLVTPQCQMFGMFNTLGL